MTKKVLAIYYSQSGQLGEIIDQFTAPLIAGGVGVEKISIAPAEEYPFPWTTSRFFSVMPDSVLGAKVALKTLTFRESAYDLIIVGYQAWFLSPSIPINSLLRHPDILALLKNTPVVTITGARNMWLNAFVQIKKLLSVSGARLVGNIALVDRHLNPISFVTIFHWMLRGRKDRYLNFFPLPGVSDADIKHTRIFGTHVLNHLNNAEWNGLQTRLTSEGAVRLNYNLMVIESVAGKIFTFWANFIIRRQNRSAWLVVFKYYLLIAFFIGAPIIITFDALFLKPFSPARIKTKKNYYLNLN